MQEVFEKIIERLKENIHDMEICEETKLYSGVFVDTPYKMVKLQDVIEIVKQTYAEYNNGWILCSDRLPEESLNSVLGWDEYRQRCCIVQYYSGRWILGNDDEPVKIIAWQPLPEPCRVE